MTNVYEESEVVNRPRKLERETKNKWLKALRSGDYKQRSEVLKGPLYDEVTGEDTGETGFCCLGVACEIGIASKRKNGDEMCDETFLDSDLQTTLAQMNDGHSKYTIGPSGQVKVDVPPKSFLEIADWIEQNL